MFFFLNIIENKEYALCNILLNTSFFFLYIFCRYSSFFLILKFSYGQNSPLTNLYRNQRFRGINVICLLIKNQFSLVKCSFWKSISFLKRDSIWIKNYFIWKKIKDIKENFTMFYEKFFSFKIEILSLRNYTFKNPIDYKKILQFFIITCWFCV